MKRMRNVVWAGAAGILALGILAYAKEGNASAAGTEGRASWHENGVRQGLYTNPELKDTVGVLFQNETLDSVLLMSRDPELDGWSVENFFAGTVFQDLTVEDLEGFYAGGYRDMEEVLAALGY